MNESLNDDNYEELVELYVAEKKRAYNFYKEFELMSRNEKIIYIQEISKCALPAYIKEAIVSTLLYPNDTNIINTTGVRIDNYSILKDKFKLDSIMISSKKREYKMFNVEKLIKDGVFTLEEMSQGDVNGDVIYREFFDELKKDEKIQK